MPKIIQVRNFGELHEDEWRVLSALETGMRNHEYVPLDLLSHFAGINRTGKNFINIIKNTLIPNRLVAFEGAGYRLTNLGYDFLALHKFINSETVLDLNDFQFFGTGKESDLYVCKSGLMCHENLGINVGIPIVLKFHRLGRTSFKQVKNKREYKSGNNCSWIYMNRISATREYNTMKELYEAQLPVPIPIGQNRGAVAMEYIYSCPLFKFPKLVLNRGAAEVLYKQGKDLLIKLAEVGLIHGDFNEFNLLVEVNNESMKSSVLNNEGIDENNSDCKVNSDSTSENDEESSTDNTDGEDEEEEENEESESEEESSEEIEDDEEEDEIDCPFIDQDVKTFKLRMIDFPQVISRNNATAQEIYTRDRQGLLGFFSKFMNITNDDCPPENIEDIKQINYLDVKLQAPGYLRSDKQFIESNTDSDKKKRNKVHTVEEIKKRIEKEKLNKKSISGKINKQQRNIRKQEGRRDIKNDIFY